MDRADGFAVIPDDLRGMARSLVVLAAYLDQARAVVDEISPDQFGDPRLGEKTRGFVAHWKWQSDRIGKELMAAEERLVTAASNYDRVEDSQLRAEGLL